MTCSGIVELRSTLRRHGRGFNSDPSLLSHSREPHLEKLLISTD
jgi:hypothetical protein